jgi:hypothetical protein
MRAERCPAERWPKRTLPKAAWPCSQRLTQVSRFFCRRAVQEKAGRRALRQELLHRHGRRLRLGLDHGLRRRGGLAVLGGRAVLTVDGGLGAGRVLLRVLRLLGLVAKGVRPAPALLLLAAPARAAAALVLPLARRPDHAVLALAVLRGPTALATTAGSPAVVLAPTARAAPAAGTR